MTVTIILVTAWHATCAENQTDTENEINDGSVKYETQSTAGAIGDVWVSGAGEMFHVQSDARRFSGRCVRGSTKATIQLHRE